MRQIEKGGEEDAGLAKAVVVALQAGENQIGFFFLNRGSQRFCGTERVELGEIVIGDVNGAVSAFCESFLDGLLHTLWTHGKDDHFAAMLFLEAQRFFERVTVGLVHLEADVGLLDPVSSNRQRRVLRGNLLNADDDVHGTFPCKRASKNGKKPAYEEGGYRTL